MYFCHNTGFADFSAFSGILGSQNLWQTPRTRPYIKNYINVNNKTLGQSYYAYACLAAIALFAWRTDLCEA